VTRRARAVVGLRHFPTRATWRLLSALLADERAPSLVRRKAASSLAAAFGDSSVPALEARAGDPDPRLRDDVARALATVGSPRAREVLRQRLGVETTWVRATVLRALGASR
jgi:HEAT repeat protein